MLPLLGQNRTSLFQVVNMEFEGGATVAFSMVAFTEKLGVRKTTIYGTKVNPSTFSMLENPK